MHLWAWCCAQPLPPFVLHERLAYSTIDSSIDCSKDRHCQLHNTSMLELRIDLCPLTWGARRQSPPTLFNHAQPFSLAVDSTTRSPHHPDCVVTTLGNRQFVNYLGKEDNNVSHSLLQQTPADPGPESSSTKRVARLCRYAPLTICKGRGKQRFMVYM